MASGTGAQIGLTRIGSLYRDVDSVNIWTNFVTENLEHKLGELEEGSITGRRDAPPSNKGLDTGLGDINYEPNPNAMAYFLKGYFGTSVSSTFCAAGSTGANSVPSAGALVSWHQFTPRQSAFSDRTFLEPHNVMVYRDVGSAWIFRGAIFPSLKLDIAGGALVKSTVNVMARKVELLQRTSTISSLVSSGGRPWTWDMASVEISTDTTSANLAAKSNFEKISFNFSLPHEGVVLLDGTKFHGEYSPNQFRRIAIDGVMSFRDQAEYLAFRAYESRRLRMTLLNVNSAIHLGNPASLDATSFKGYYGIRLHIPLMKYLTWAAPVQGPNRITVSFTAKAEYSDAEGFMNTVEMMNLVTSTDLTSVY